LIAFKGKASMGRKRKGKLMGGVKSGFNGTLTVAIQGGEARVTRGGGRRRGSVAVQGRSWR
jgi:hypothetical protein